MYGNVGSETNDDMMMEWHVDHDGLRSVFVDFIS